MKKSVLCLPSAENRSVAGVLRSGRFVECEDRALANGVLFQSSVGRLESPPSGQAGGVVVGQRIREADGHERLILRHIEPAPVMLSLTCGHHVCKMSVSQGGGSACGTRELVRNGRIGRVKKDGKARRWSKSGYRLSATL